MDAQTSTRRSFGVFSEYGTLREVVVGSAANLALPPFGRGLTHYVPELRAVLEKTNGQRLDIAKALPEKWAKTNDQLNRLAETYERFGVRVYRPRPFTAPEFEHLSELQPGHSQLYPADPVFVVGGHYIEVCIRRAYRRKEIYPLRDIVMPLVGADKNARYATMPQAMPYLPAADGPGPFLEGGDMLVCGKHVLVGEHYMTSNRAGIDWLRSYLIPFGWEVHAVPLQGDLLHLLGTMCLLREGLLMAYLPALKEGLPKPVQDWDVIELEYDEGTGGTATVGVSLDEKRYLTNGKYGRVLDVLAARGVEPIPVECDMLEYWGGGVRCCTLPLVRDS